MTKRILAAAIVAALATMPAFASASPKSENSFHSERHNPFANIPVSGTDVVSGNSFKGTMDIIGFVDGDKTGTTEAIGVLFGTITKPDGSKVKVENETIHVPLNRIDPACQILNLDLGPLDLNLLGLQIHLNEVVLNIVAQPGPGNLLGNLLCAVANLLNGTGALSGLITTLLNNIAVILAGLAL